MSTIGTIIITILILCAIAGMMADGDVGCFTLCLFAFNVIALVLAIASLVLDTQKSTSKTETTTEVTTVVTTVAPHYTATVKNADGSETKYDITSYETKDGTMELTLKDGTKVFVPVVNITIAEQTIAVETTTETK